MVAPPSNALPVEAAFTSAAQTSPHGRKPSSSPSRKRLKTPDFIRSGAVTRSNRRAVGLGHTAIEPIIAALREIDYAGYLSAEILPLPDAATAARQTMESFRRALTLC